jgi:signal recognition particle GTPase
MIHATAPGRRFYLFKRFSRSPQSEDKTNDALDRTRRTWFRRVAGLFERSRIDDELWEELEELLIGADVGVATTTSLIERLRTRVRRGGNLCPQARRYIGGGCQRHRQDHQHRQAGRRPEG